MNGCRGVRSGLGGVVFVRAFGWTRRLCAVGRGGACPRSGILGALLFTIALAAAGTVAPPARADTFSITYTNNGNSVVINGTAGLSSGTAGSAAAWYKVSSLTVTRGNETGAATLISSTGGDNSATDFGAISSLSNQHYAVDNFIHLYAAQPFGTYQGASVVGATFGGIGYTFASSGHGYLIGAGTSGVGSIELLCGSVGNGCHSATNNTQADLTSGGFTVDASPGPIPGAGLLSYLIAALESLRISLPPAFAALPAATSLRVSVALDPVTLPGALRLPALFEPAWRFAAADYTWRMP